LDWLRDSVAAPFERKGGALFKDPWAARDDYIGVVLDRSPGSVERFFARHAAGALGDAEQTTTLKLLELQRHAMLMYTSCGWFFDDLSGIETVQVLQYAGRAVHLAQELFGNHLEEILVGKLAAAKSNLPDAGDGRLVYEKLVLPAKVDWERLGAHYAVSSLFASYPQQTRIYSYMAEKEDYHVFEAGKAKMVIGRVNLTSEITRESAALSFGVLQMGDHNINGGVQNFLGVEAYRELAREVTEPFMRADFAQVIRLMDRSFGESNYSIRSLFRDEQRGILDIILASTLGEAETLYRQIYENRAPMMRFLTTLNIPLPKAFYAAAEFVLNGYLRRALEEEDVDVERVRVLLDTARLEGVSLDTATLEFAYRHNLERMAERLLANPTEIPLKRLANAASLIGALPFGVDLWKIQNIYYRILETVYPKIVRQKSRGHESAQQWVDRFEALGRKLTVRVPAD
jgi:hypothetical protein